MKNRWNQTEIELLKQNWQKPMSQLQEMLPRFTYNAIKAQVNYLGFKRRPEMGLDRNFFSKCDTPQKAYLLGALEAEGSIGLNKIALSLGKKEQVWITNLRDLTGSHATIGIAQGSLGPGLRVEFCSKQWVHDLKQLGFRSGQLPPLPDSLMSYWLRGLFDGDGTIVYNKVDACMTSAFYGTENLLTEVRDYLLGHGIECQNVRCNVTCYALQLHRLPTRALAFLMPEEKYMLQRKGKRLKLSIDFNHLAKKVRRIELDDITQKIYEG